MTASRKRICLLGSTGSIGQNTLRVASDFPDQYEVVGLSAHRSADELLEQVARFKPRAACLSGSDQPPPSANGTCQWFAGERGVLDMIEACEPDLLIVAMVGAAGLSPTLHAIDLGIPIGLANKEVLVTAGELTMSRARERDVAVLPVDSEHNAIFQCLQGHEGAPLRRIILTASGGPFRGKSRGDLETVSTEQALDHPTWNMGPKITIDSATLMNKGFEAIEAHHLFGLPPAQIEVIVHPQSIVHSMVEFHDGSMLAQLGVTDMYFPIANVLSHPDRLPNSRFGPLDLASLGTLTFEASAPETFTCLKWAFEAMEQGGTYPAALNAANEVAVERFLAGSLKFLEIADMIDATLQAHTPGDAMDRGAIEETDRWARQFAATSALSKT